MSEANHPLDPPPPVASGAGAESLCLLSLTAQSALIARRDICCEELTAAHLARCASLNPTLNAFITIAADGAIERARALDDEIRRGRYRGRLHGIPIAHKDIIDTAFVSTTYGSALFRHNVPQRDAAVVSRLHDAGAVLLGKCNLDEFAGTSTGDNPWYGLIRNPAADGLSPSGSSGGSAAAVAAHLCAGATGTDTGGSIRNPSACTGIVGLKPTRDLVSVAGTFPLCPTLDVVGPMARTVDDLAALLGAMVDAGAENRMAGENIAWPTTAVTSGAALVGMRVAFCPDLHFATLDRRIEEGLARAADVFASLGSVVEVRPFASRDALASASDVVFHAEMYATHADHLASHPEGYSDSLAHRILGGSGVSRDAYAAALEATGNLQREFIRQMADVDALILPISPSSGPPTHDGTCTVNGTRKHYGAVGRTMRMWVNLLGCPALALPMGQGDGGPIGFQLVGKPFAEARLIRLGRAYEMAAGNGKSGRK